MRKLTFSFMLLFLFPFAASATPVSISVEGWQTVDGNFGFSVVHSATGGLMQMGGLDFYAGGVIQYEFSSPTQFMSGDLTGSVLSIDASSLSLDGGSLFKVQSSVLDFGVANGDLIGALGYELVDSGGSAETGAFYFYNFDFTNGSCDANALCQATGEYRLWGNNWANAISDRPDDNVMIDRMFATRHRGIDLGGDFVSAPIPEPSSAVLFGFGALAVGGGLRRR